MQKPIYSPDDEQLLMSQLWSPQLKDDPRFQSDLQRGEHGAYFSELMAQWCAGHSRAEALAFADSIRAVKEKLRPCRTCFNLAEGDECGVCLDPRRDRTLVCVVEQVRDLGALFRGAHWRSTSSRQ